MEFLILSINNIQVNSNSVKVVDSNTLEFITPPGQLGEADISLITPLQELELSSAFTYLQPVKSNIVSVNNDKFYDVKVDPTGTYAVAAAGNGGVIIYNID